MRQDTHARDTRWRLAAWREESWLGGPSRGMGRLDGFGGGGSDMVSVPGDALSRVEVFVCASRVAEKKSTTNYSWRALVFGVQGPHQYVIGVIAAAALR